MLTDKNPRTRNKCGLAIREYSSLMCRFFIYRQGVPVCQHPNVFSPCPFKGKPDFKNRD